MPDDTSDQRTGHSRRTFLRGAGATAAAVTATTLVPGAAYAATGRGSSDDDGAADAATDTLVAYVKDAKSGQIVVMSGDREVTVTDRRLAQRLARLAD